MTARQRDGAATLPCTNCRQELPVAAFRVNRYGSRSSWCSPCHVAATREWRAANRDAINARRRSNHLVGTASGALAGPQSGLVPAPPPARSQSRLEVPR